MKTPDLKICLICSTGGHMKQLLKLRQVYEKYNHYYLLFYKESIKNFIHENRVHIVVNPERNFFIFIWHFIQSLIVFIKEQPDVTITTGAGVAIATCYLARLFHKRVIFIEDWCVITEPSLTGRLLHPIADLFIVQRDSLIRFYPKAIVGGSLF